MCAKGRAAVREEGFAEWRMGLSAKIRELQCRMA